MKVVFADTGYWIALLNPQDELHNKARKISELLNPVHIITSEAVLIKVFSYFSQQGEMFEEVASNLIDSVHQHPNTTVVSQTSVQFRAGMLFHMKRPNQAWSLTDCVSFKIMESQGISEALTYNEHFEQAGYIALLRD